MANESERKERSKQQEIELRDWIEEVVGGKTPEGALGSRIQSIRIRRERAAELLLDGETRGRLVQALLLSGQADRAREVVGIAAVMQLDKAVGAGELKAILEALPQGKSKPAMHLPTEANAHSVLQGQRKRKARTMDQVMAEDQAKDARESESQDEPEGRDGAVHDPVANS